MKKFTKQLEKDTLEIRYRKFESYKSVNLENLRPKDSYGKLLESRTHSIDQFIKDYGRIPSDLLAHRACPNCSGGGKIKELSKDHLELVRCKDCDLVYVDPIFNEEHYKNAYKSQEYQQVVRDLGEESHCYRVQRFGVERVEVMKKYLRSVGPPCFLDIGCSTGFVVEAARLAGWDAQGIDLNPSAVEFGRRRGLELQNIALQDLDAQSATFDAIGLFDVLEHVVEPKKLLERSIYLLKPGGIIFLYVPNYDSASRLLMGKEAHFIWPTHHLTYFTPITVKKFIESMGLKLEMMVTEGLDIFDYIWAQEHIHGKKMQVVSEIADRLQFFINGALWGKNLRVLARIL